MQVILIQDVDNLGGRNELVNVKNGYARNYLIPQKFAVEASASNLKQYQERLKVITKKEAAMLAELNKVIEVLKASSASKARSRTAASRCRPTSAASRGWMPLRRQLVLRGWGINAVNPKGTVFLLALVRRCRRT